MNDVKEIEKDTERDYFMTSDEALSYGIIDKILWLVSVISVNT